MNTQAIHMLDLALNLTGPVKSVLALVAKTNLHRMEAEDFANASLRFVNGAVGSLIASTASFRGRPEMIILHFENASLNLASGVLTVNWRDGRSERFSETPSGEIVGMVPKHLGHQRIIEDFVVALSNGGEPRR